jgi:hypothetical protein
MRKLCVLIPLALTWNCAKPAPPPSSANRPVVLGALRDSAEIERLCADPDKVRAGRAECVLKNQALPPKHTGTPEKPPPE